MVLHSETNPLSSSILERNHIALLKPLKKAKVRIAVASQNDDAGISNFCCRCHMPWAERQRSSIRTFQHDLVDIQAWHDQFRNRPRIGPGPGFDVLLAGQGLGPGPL